MKLTPEQIEALELDAIENPPEIKTEEVFKAPIQPTQEKEKSDQEEKEIDWGFYAPYFLWGVYG